MQKIERNKDKSYDVKIDWSSDLKLGELGEQTLIDILDSKSIEVKTDLMWQKTGNIALEIYCHGKPSGIQATKSDFWAVLNIIDGGAVGNIIILPTTSLKSFAKRVYTNIQNYPDCRIVQGGDNKSSTILLMPLEMAINHKKLLED